MFMLMPKHRPRAGPPTDGHETKADPADHDTTGPARTPTACDSCRVRKAKCNGQRPCSRCREKHIICVYGGREGRRDVVATPARVALLQNQLDRSTRALQNMAVVIARQEDGLERSAESMDVLQLLDRFAPQTEPELELRLVGNSNPPKRRLSAYSSREEVPAAARFRQMDPLESRTVPSDCHGNGTMGAPSQDRLSSAMQMSEFMREFSSASGRSPFKATNALNNENNLAGLDFSSGNTDFLDLIDWEASLANLPNWNSDQPEFDEQRFGASSACDMGPV